MARRAVRLEEYAASGFVVESEDVDGIASHVRVTPVRGRGALSGSGSRTVVPRAAHAASASHKQNEQYMEAFDAAYEELSVAQAAKSGQAQAGDRAPSSASRSREDKAVAGSGDARTPFGEVPMEARRGDLGGGWLQGPASPEGSVHSVSAQPIMCMSMSADASEVVVGSSDHALYVLPLRTASGTSRTVRSAVASRTSVKPRTLYTKKYGHTEWVTCATYLSDKRIVSGGMDSKLCLWDATGVKCEDLIGHSGSLSLVLCVDDDTVLSAGYDKTLRLWNVGRRFSSRERERTSIKVGSAPILDASLFAHGSSVVSGDRDGSVHLVDLLEGKVVRKLANAHTGHTTSVLASKSLGDIDADAASQTFFSGGQDGFVRVWDARQRAPSFALELHVDARSGKRGAVGFLKESPEDPNILVTGGADGTIKVLDRRSSFSVLHSFTEHMDFIYSLHLSGQLCFSGAGNGMLHVHDWRRGKLLYGLGANQAAVRAIATSASQLVAAGDDGGVIVYDME
jgi:WD40 repeat protein